MKNRNTILATGALLGGLAVALGAFGAHALKDFLVENSRTETFELAVRYQFYHAFSLLVVGILRKDYDSAHMYRAAWGFLVGCVLFSGSLYLLCFTSTKTFALLTPFGGVSLLLGWFFLLLGVIQNKKSLNT